MRRTSCAFGGSRAGFDDAPALAFITIAGTPSSISGLAVLRWGGFAPFLSHPELIAVAMAVFFLSGVALFSRGSLRLGEREDRANRWVILAFGLIGLSAGYLPPDTDRKAFWTLDGDTIRIRRLGVVLSAAGGALRLWPVFVLGRRFSGSVAVQPGGRRAAHSRLPTTRFDPPKRSCCAGSSEASTMPTATAHRGCCPGSIEASARRRFGTGRQTTIGT